MVLGQGEVLEQALVVRSSHSRKFQLGLVGLLAKRSKRRAQNSQISSEETRNISRGPVGVVMGQVVGLGWSGEPVSRHNIKF